MAGTAGLVVILDLAGQTIAALEHRVTRLEGELTAERHQRAALEELLAAARATTAHDTGHVTPPDPPATDTRPHADHPARPRS